MRARWRRLSTVGSVEEISSEEVAFPDDEPDEHSIIDLLRRTLAAQLDGVLAYNREQRAFYFPAAQGVIEQNYPYKSVKVNTSADVVKKYEKDGVLKYVRHHAFEPRFWRFGEKWFLSVTPTFVFTWDGFKPDKFASGRLAGKKKREFNSALVGQFAMWRFLLTNEREESQTTASLFKAPEQRARLRFKSIDLLSLERGVPDDLWRSSEPEEVEEASQRRLAV